VRTARGAFGAGLPGEPRLRRADLGEGVGCQPEAVLVGVRADEDRQIEVGEGDLRRRGKRLGVDGEGESGCASKR
jgi:hypothetical protein